MLQLRSHLRRRLPEPVVDVIRRVRSRLGLGARPIDWAPLVGSLAPIDEALSRLLVYSPADLNFLDGSAIWVQALVETLHVGPTHVTLPLRAPVRRTVVTEPLGRLDRVDVVDARPVVDGRPVRLVASRALGLIEWLHAERCFDAILLRSYGVCNLAIERPAIRDVVWACYVLEPERDIHDRSYVRDMRRIARSTAAMVVQSEGMRELLEQVVPEARGRTIIVPPAIPDEPSTRADPQRPAPRLVYTGKFHPFYSIEPLIDLFERLRRRIPELEFHVMGDKIMDVEHDSRFAARLRARLTSTDGLFWHGAVPRREVEARLAEGGVALSVWDYRYGPRLNDLVVSTKILDYASVGLPILLNRTRTQVDLLGADYPLFVNGMSDAEEVLEAVLADPALYAQCAGRTFDASRSFTYSAVYERVAPFLPGRRLAA